MNLNPLAVPTLLLGMALFWAVVRWAAWPTSLVKRAAIIAASLLAGTPGLLYDIYYTHWFDRAGWFYQFRSITGTELLGAGLGILVGVAAVALRINSVRDPKFRITAFLLAVALFIPYIKPLGAPLDFAALGYKRVGQVCMQTSDSTCGPACVATLLGNAGFAATESQIARECYTSRRGTENWYLARSLRRRGLDARYVVLAPNPASLPYPSIAGLGVGRAGHFVTVLGRTREGYIIGNPLSGIETVTYRDLPDYGFSGFFLVVSPRR